MVYTFSITSLFPSTLTTRGSLYLYINAVSSTNAFSKYSVWCDPTLSILVFVWLIMAYTLVYTISKTFVHFQVGKFLWVCNDAYYNMGENEYNKGTQTKEGLTNYTECR